MSDYSIFLEVNGTKVHGFTAGRVIWRVEALCGTFALQKACALIRGGIDERLQHFFGGERQHGFTAGRVICVEYFCPAKPCYRPRAAERSLGQSARCGCKALLGSKKPWWG